MSPTIPVNSGTWIYIPVGAANSGMTVYPSNTNFWQPQVWQYAESCGCNIDEDESTIPPGNERWWNA